MDCARYVCQNLNIRNGKRSILHHDSFINGIIYTSMHPELQKNLQLKFFKEEGFVRKKCKKCGSYFWTKVDRETCNEYPCNGYSFIGNPPGKKMGLHEMREAFLSFFEKHNHTRLKRYPVVARWRDDIYLTIASIANFQPHVTSGEVPPPANPLVISQPSIRLNDLDEVGKSGKHLTIFEMMGHHAFNNHEKIYWTEETIRYCQEFLESIGIEDVVYKEAEWAGGGNAGACLEVIVDGLEVATLVFMNLKERKDGRYEVKGKRYDEMPMKIVDTGYGLERLVWLVNGSRNIYEAIFPEIIEKIGVENEYSYAIADHTKCLAFMLGDGIVPSNTGVGYLARLMIRRTLRLMNKIDSDIDVFEIIDEHLKYLKKDFPELVKERSRIKEILEIESGKYYATLERGKNLVKRYARKKIGIDELIELYDSHGIHPEVVKEIVDVDIPPNFESIVAQRHSESKERKMKEEEKYPYETEKMYYKRDYEREFDAEIVYAKDGMVILDKTLFYPEGGGEKSDTGYLIQNGKKVRVKYVKKAGESIIHYVDGKLEKGKVHGLIDWERRYAMMRHHTATHIINAACRKILGNHVWQAGSELDEKEARLDITHYKRISDKEMRKIEKEANKMVSSFREVKKFFMRRDIAEKKYGMILYQGGPPKANILRIVEIPGIDVEACGGMHVNNTGEIGIIKVIGSERIQDGVERIRFCAGERAIEYIQEEERLLKKMANLLKTDISRIEKVIEKIVKENKELHKKIERAQKSIAKYEEYNGIKIIIHDDLALKTIKELTREKSVVISAMQKDKNAIITIACSPDLPLDCSIIAKSLAEKFGGKGGGRRTIGQAGIYRNLDDAKKEAISMVKDEIEKHT